MYGISHSHNIIYYSPRANSSPSKKETPSWPGLYRITLGSSYPVPVNSRVLSNSVEEKYSNTQPFLDPFPMSRASPPSLLTISLLPARPGYRHVAPTPCIRLATHFAADHSHISLVMSEIFPNFFVSVLKIAQLFCFSTGISTGTGYTVNGTGKRISFGPREKKEGWPLMTIETEANGDLWFTYERGPSLVGSLGRYKRFLSCLGC